MSGVPRPIGKVGSSGGGGDPIVESTGVAILADNKTPGTNGGTFTSGSRQTRDVNTEKADTDDLVSFFSNQMTVVQGRYLIYACATGNQVNVHRVSLRNITDGEDIAIGVLGEVPGGSGNDQTTSYVVGILDVLDGTKVIEVQHQCFITSNGDGLGRRANFGETENYMQILFHKVQ